jgi:hemin uptake protein HemP
MCLLSGENENEKKCRIPNAIQIINSEKLFHSQTSEEIFFSIAHLITFVAE